MGLLSFFLLQNCLKQGYFLKWSPKFGHFAKQPENFQLRKAIFSIINEHNPGHGPSLVGPSMGLGLGPARLALFGNFYKKNGEKKIYLEMKKKNRYLRFLTTFFKQKS